MDWALSTHYPRRRLAADTTLFQEGDLGERMYLIVTGRLQVSKRVITGAERVLSLLDAGQYVGEMSLLTGAKRSATVKAVVDTEVVEIDQQAFVALLHDHPEVGLELMRQMARRLEETDEELVLLALEAALAQRRPSPRPTAQRLRFIATGSFASDRAAEVLRRAAEQAPLANSPALLLSLLRPGHTRNALVYILETENPRDLLDLVSPFADLVQWDISPAVDLYATPATPETAMTDDPSPPFL